MKKIILEEIKNMKYLLGYKRGVVISEQEEEANDLIDKYSAKSMGNNIDSGALQNLDPKAAEAAAAAQKMIGGTNPPNAGTTTATAGATTTTDVGATTAAGKTTETPATTTTATPIKIGVKYPSIVELQNSLNTKFKSGLTPDGKYGPKTSTSILTALQNLSTTNKGGDTNTPPNVVVGDSSSEVIKKTAEAGAPNSDVTKAPDNGVASTEPNKESKFAPVGSDVDVNGYV